MDSLAHRPDESQLKHPLVASQSPGPGKERKKSAQRRRGHVLCPDLLHGVAGVNQLRPRRDAPWHNSHDHRCRTMLFSLQLKPKTFPNRLGRRILAKIQPPLPRAVTPGSHCSPVRLRLIDSPPPPAEPCSLQSPERRDCPDRSSARPKLSLLPRRQSILVHTPSAPALSLRSCAAARCHAALTAGLRSWRREIKRVAAGWSERARHGTFNPRGDFPALAAPRSAQVGRRAHMAGSD